MEKNIPLHSVYEKESAIESIAHAQTLSPEYKEALVYIAHQLDNWHPEAHQTIPIDFYIDEASDIYSIPKHERKHLYTAFKATQLYLQALQSLPDQIKNSDTKIIIQLLENFGNSQGYRPKKAENEAHEVIITILKD